jgi:hypothetical protein
MFLGGGGVSRILSCILPAALTAGKHTGGLVILEVEIRTLLHCNLPKLSEPLDWPEGRNNKKGVVLHVDTMVRCQTVTYFSLAFAVLNLGDELYES